MTILRRSIFIGIIVLVLGAIAFKTASTVMATTRTVNSVESAVDSLLNPAATTSARIDFFTIADALTDLEREVRLIQPLLNSDSGDRCILNALIDFLPVASELSTTLAPLGDSARVMLGPLRDPATLAEGVPVAALREAWATANIDSAEWTQRLRTTAAEHECATEGARFADEYAGYQGLLVALELFFNVPWDEVLADGRHWVFVLNNSDEIRATGGFTTALMDVRVIDGRLRWHLRNSHAIEDAERVRYRPAAPEPQLRYMERMMWTFRDANWSPHYPQSAADTLFLYAFDEGTPEPDGLVTVNLSALHTVMGHIPVLYVREEAITQETVLDGVREAWGTGGAEVIFNETSDDRKNFLFDFALSLGQAYGRQLGWRDRLASLGAVPALLDGRDVLIYSDAMQPYLAERRWDGAMIETPGDYLMVVESNLGYNKVTPRIERQMQYAVDLVSEVPTATLTLTYRNTNQNDLSCTRYNHFPEGVLPTYFMRMDGCYWNYLRFFGPDELRLLSAQTHEAPAEWFQFRQNPNRGEVTAIREAGREGIGTMLVVPVNAERAVSFTYGLPATVREDFGIATRYRLYVQAQPGLFTPAPLQISIALPPGSTLIEQPEGAVLNGSTLVLNVDGRTDHDLQITYQ